MGENFVVDPPVHGDARAFLTPVLECIKPEIGDFSRFRMFIKAKNPTFVFGAFTWRENGAGTTTWVNGIHFWLSQ
jgi:hypothetical protein